MRKVFYSLGEIGFPYEGIFLAWGLELYEGVTFTVALIEKPDGTVIGIEPWRIKFAEPLAF